MRAFKFGDASILLNVITNAFKLQIKTFFNQTSLQKPIKSSAAYANFQSIRILGTVIYFLQEQNNH